MEISDSRISYRWFLDNKVYESCTAGCINKFTVMLYKGKLTQFVIKSLLAFSVVALLASPLGAQNNEGIIQTVQGPVGREALGMTLSHEHLFSNFGLPIDETDSYDEAALFAQVIPYLRMLHGQGVRTIFDYTTSYFGRRADLLRAMSDSTGILIVTNTGIYGAADDRYVPTYAFSESVAELAQRWIAEAEDGIDGTGILPGFIKLAFDDGPPSDIDRKLFKAGLLTHLATGLSIAVHTGSNPDALQLQLELLDEYGVHPGAWIWTHANWHDDFELVMEVAQRGAWISMDGVNSENIGQYLEYIRKFMEAGLIGRLLISHDGDAYPAGEEIRPFEAIQKELIPAMRSGGFPESVITQLLIENPGEAFAIRVRRTGQ
jgi:predicted metal-dependent phosphotriesterase family hydrolase